MKTRDGASVRRETGVDEWIQGLTWFPDRERVLEELKVLPSLESMRGLSSGEIVKMVDNSFSGLLAVLVSSETGRANDGNS